MVYTWEQLVQEEILSYDIEKYNFRALFQKIMGWDDLENIHTSNLSVIEGALDFKDDQSTKYHRTFYDSPYLPEFEELYAKFVEEFLSPMFEDKELVVQTRPTFRISVPGSTAIGQKHCDYDYNHPEYEINFWVPVTEVKGNNGFFTESEPGKGDYHHCGDMKPGQLIRFWGNKCQHYNEINETGSTRISFDLRIIPKSKFVERKETTVKSGLSFTLGSYYTLFQRTDE